MPLLPPVTSTVRGGDGDDVVVVAAGGEAIEAAMIEWWMRLEDGLVVCGAERCVLATCECARETIKIQA